MNEQHQLQMTALDEARSTLQQAGIPTYSVLLTMSREQYGTATAIRCVLDTRKFVGQEAAAEQEERARGLAESIATTANLDLEVLSTGHTFTQ